MKRIACIATLACLLAVLPGLSSAQADIQTDAQTGSLPLEFGVRAGLNYGMLGGDDIVTSSSPFVVISEGPRSGFVVGAFAVYDLQGPLSVQPELMYVQKGHKIDLTVSALGASSSGSLTMKISYLEVPILARYDVSVDDESAITAHVIAGPTLGYRISSNVESDVDGDVSTERLDGLKKTELGLSLGAGSSLDLVSGKAVIDARFGVGLTNIFDGSGTLRTLGFMLTAGFIF